MGVRLPRTSLLLRAQRLHHLSAMAGLQEAQTTPSHNISTPPLCNAILSSHICLLVCKSSKEQTNSCNRLRHSLKRLRHSCKKLRPSLLSVGPLPKQMAAWSPMASRRIISPLSRTRHNLVRLLMLLHQTCSASKAHLPLHPPPAEPHRLTCISPPSPPLKSSLLLIQPLLQQ